MYSFNKIITNTYANIDSNSIKKACNNTAKKSMKDLVTIYFVLLKILVK